MARHLEAALGGVTLRTAAPLTAINNITETPREDASWGAPLGAEGQILLSDRRAGNLITLEFVIEELFNLAARTQQLDLANGWAKPGYFTRSDRPGKRIRVIPAEYAHIASARDFTEVFRLGLEASPCPYWEDATPTELALTGSNTTGLITVPGTAETVADVTVSHTSGTLNTLTLALGDTQMSFSGLNIPANTNLTLDHDENGNLRIRAGNVSKYGCRSAGSDDELSALPGARAVTVTANVTCNVTLQARGRWK